MMQINVVGRYSTGSGTKKEIEDFNNFYDLEEARLKHEEKMQIEWSIQDFMERVF